MTQHFGIYTPTKRRQHIVVIQPEKSIFDKEDLEKPNTLFL